MTSSAVEDLEALIQLVIDNYAGYGDKLRALGPIRLEQAAEAARAVARDRASPASGDEALRIYLSTFADGHLSLAPTPGGRHEPSAPSPELTAAPTTLHVLSDSTVLLTIPGSFALAAKSQLVDLLHRHDGTIRSTPCLIIDLRGNTGGSDATYSSLLPYLYTGPMEVVGVDVLASEGNARQWEAMAAMIPEDEPDLAREVRDIVRRMRAHPGEFVSLPDGRITFPEVMPLPERVGIIVDGACASAAEQFLLAAQQSTKTIVFGQPTRGVLDFSNPVPFPLPSGTRTVMIPTTRSRRLPTAPVDGVGIIPDITLKTENAARWVEIVREHLERMRGAGPGEARLGIVRADLE